MIRVPAVLVGLVCACASGAAAFWLAQYVADTRVLVALLPVIAWISSFISGRWSDRPAPVPGLAIGLLALAVRAGLGMGTQTDLFFYIEPGVALLEIFAAISGGMAGTLLARRAAQLPAPKASWITS